MQEAHTQPPGPIYSPREGTFLLKYEAFVSGALTQSNCPAQIFHKLQPQFRDRKGEKSHQNPAGKFGSFK